MHRVDHLLEGIESPDNLRLAFWKARKGKSHTLEVEQYRQHLDDHLTELGRQIREGIVDVGNYHFFKVYEPKERQICAAAFHEQVLHHALMNVCHPYFEKALIFHSYACRKNKGPYAALDKAQRLTQSRQWFLKLDVRKFFESVHHDVLKGQLARKFREERLLHVFSQIIDSYPTMAKRGLPIGNLTSQYFANHYLSGLDHYICTELKQRDYVRYMDDMILWSDSKGTLVNACEKIAFFMENRLLCSLKPIQLNRSNTGLPFLGYNIFPDQMRLLQQSKRRYIAKYKLATKQLSLGKIGQSEYQRRLNALTAFIEHANSEPFRRNLIYGQLP